MKLLPYFSIIPCLGKQPLVPWQEFIKRHPTEEESKKWDELYPDGDRGIICGPISRLFVLDIDGEEGKASLEGYNIPKTATVKTPHGEHHYFRWIPELDAKVTTKVGILNKVDVRGEGGFVRFYGWKIGPNIRPLLAPPQWLLDLLPNRNAPKIIDDTFKKLDYEKSLQTLKDLPRHNTLYQIAGGLRSRGYSSNEIYELLAPKGREVGLPEKDIRYIADRMERYPMGQRPPIEEVVVPENFEQFLTSDIKVEYLVPGIFPKKGIAFVAGLPETSKTWTLIDLAIEVAKEKDGRWLDHFPVNHGRVLFIDQERPKEETQRRFKALLAAKNLNPKDFNESLHIQCGSTIRLNLEVSFTAFRKLLADVRPDVVIVDSFKTFHTHDINSNVSMQEVLERVKALRNEFGCSFIFIFHENKGAFERVGADGKKKEIDFSHMAGAMVMSEVAESILITVRQDQISSFLHHVKNSYGTKQAPITVAVEDLSSDKSKIRVVAR